MPFTLRVQVVGYQECRFEVSTCQGSATCITTDRHILVVDGVVFDWKPVDMLRQLESNGIDFLRTLDGLFVLVLFEKSTNRSIVLRDPLGRRTAFVSTLQNGYCISNQPEAFDSSPEASNLRIAAYLGVCDFPQEMTYHAGVIEVSAGTCYEVQWDGHFQPIWQWELPRGENATTFAGEVANLNDVLIRALDRVIAAYQPKKLGIMLSGGVDSGLIAFYARKFCNLTCLTWSFEDEDMDE